jgi:hypothetical protein
MFRSLHQWPEIRHVELEIDVDEGIVERAEQIIAVAPLFKIFHAASVDDGGAGGQVTPHRRRCPARSPAPPRPRLPPARQASAPGEALNSRPPGKGQPEEWRTMRCKTTYFHGSSSLASTVCT